MSAIKKKKSDLLVKVVNISLFIFLSLDYSVAYIYMVSSRSYCRHSKKEHKHMLF